VDNYVRVLAILHRLLFAILKRTNCKVVKHGPDDNVDWNDPGVLAYDIFCYIQYLQSDEYYGNDTKLDEQAFLSHATHFAKIALLGAAGNYRLINIHLGTTKWTSYWHRADVLKMNAEFRKQGHLVRWIREEGLGRP
jgi:hypothetical protein